MTNLEIIYGACQLYGIKDEVDTYIGWKRRGFQVQKGQKAVFKTKIWKPVRGKVTVDTEETEETNKHLILVDASFFTDKQVEEVK